MESLERILKKRALERLNGCQTMIVEGGTSQPAIRCNICKDTLFVLGDNGRFSYCRCVQRRRLEALWKNFGVAIDNIKRLGEYIPYDESTNKVKKMAIRYIDDIKRNGFKNNKSFGILGQSGAGKSHISIAIGGALIESGLKVVYLPYIEGMRELKGRVLDQGEYDELRMRYSMADILIIDDLFKDKFSCGRVISPISESDMRHFYPIVNYRYNNGLPTIFSSECSIKEIMAIDCGLGSRIFESCGGNVVYFCGSGYNYRTRKLLGEV